MSKLHGCLFCGYSPSSRQHYQRLNQFRCWNWLSSTFLWSHSWQNPFRASLVSQLLAPYTDALWAFNDFVSTINFATSTLLHLPRSLRVEDTETWKRNLVRVLSNSKVRVLSNSKVRVLSNSPLLHCRYWTLSLELVCCNAESYILHSVPFALFYLLYLSSAWVYPCIVLSDLIRHHAKQSSSLCLSMHNNKPKRNGV